MQSTAPCTYLSTHLMWNSKSAQFLTHSTIENTHSLWLFIYRTLPTQPQRRETCDWQNATEKLTCEYLSSAGQQRDYNDDERRRRSCCTAARENSNFLSPLLMERAVNRLRTFLNLCGLHKSVSYLNCYCKLHSCRVLPTHHAVAQKERTAFIFHFFPLLI